MYQYHILNTHRKRLICWSKDSYIFRKFQRFLQICFNDELCKLGNISHLQDIHYSIRWKKRINCHFENRTSEMSDYAKLQGITFIGDDDVINQVKYTIGCHDVSIYDLWFFHKHFVILVTCQLNVPRQHVLRPWSARTRYRRGTYDIR